MSFEVDTDDPDAYAVLIDEDGDELQVEINYEDEKVSFRTTNNEVYVSFDDVDKLIEYLGEGIDS